jgi:hypothetical protein
MAADTLIDIVVNQKSSLSVEFELLNNGVPFNLTNYGVSAKYKEDLNVSDELSQPFNSAIANTTAGIIAITLTPEQTGALSNPRYVYDVTLTNTNTGYKIRVIEGILKVSRGVT